MAFAPNDHLKIIKFLQLSIDKSEEIQQRLGEIEDNDPVLETEIKAVMAQLTTLATNLSSARNNVNSSLTKADSLEWDIERKFDGMIKERNELQFTLANLLGYPLTVTATNYSFNFGSSSGNIHAW
jgi:DNA repair ATPase RecN